MREQVEGPRGQENLGNVAESHAHGPLSSHISLITLPVTAPSPSSLQSFSNILF